MNIGYIKIIKKPSKIANKITYYICKLFNIVKREESNKHIYYIYNSSEKTKKKLNKILKKNNEEYVITENNFKIDYQTLDEKYLTKYMIPEIIDYIYKFWRPRTDEIYICTNKYNENIEIIEDLTKKVKVVNIVTNNDKYYNLEEKLEEKNIYITVSENKRKALKKAEIVINLDFQTFKDYNINRDMIIIDILGNLNINKGFQGTIIKSAKIKTNKVLRIFSEFENFEKDKLIEAEIMQINNYEKIRQYIKYNKIYVESCKNNSIIDFKLKSNKKDTSNSIDINSM